MSTALSTITGRLTPCNTWLFYRNKGNSKAYPYLLDAQSDIIR